MSGVVHEFLVRDLFPLSAGALSALVCGLLGNLLVLRRQSLMGDTISHAVLPGLVVAFLVTGSRAPAPMLVGAALAGLGAVALYEIIRRYGRVEPSAAMGVSFSLFFALGVVLIERAARQVDLDADCVLHGQLEYLVWWDAPETWGELASLGAWAGAPTQVTSLAATLVVSALFVGALFKELRITLFDPGLARSQGVPTGALRAATLALVAAAAVASFEAVGSILVIAMLVGPAATARLLTDRMAAQLWASVGLALSAVLIGYALAATAPSWLPPSLGVESSLNAAGVMAVVVGVQMTLAVLFAPTHGAAARWSRRRSLSRRVWREDLVVAIGGARAIETIQRRAARDARRAGLIERRDGAWALTERGRRLADRVRRRRNEWSAYLVDRAGVRPDHVEGTVERLEHLAPKPLDPLSPRDDRG